MEVLPIGNNPLFYTQDVILFEELPEDLQELIFEYQVGAMYALC